MQQAGSLDKVGKGELCSGCGLCQAVTAPGRIQMRITPEGFYRPYQQSSLTEVEDRLIGETCPGLRLDQRSTEGERHTVWGPIIKVRKGYSTDSDMRHHASSGGVLSALLLYLLDTKSVDYVVQTSVSEESPILNAVCESTGRDQVFHAAGSRYGPSAPLSKLDTQLEKPGQFAFVGKPCDVAALRAYARHDDRIQDKIPYFISFYCAGIPSLKGTREILTKLGTEEGELTGFRYRGDGWPGFTTALTRDKRELRMSYADAWGGILSKHQQFRCKICPDGSGGFADVVCADAWYGDETGYPIFDEADGWSLIVSRTARGEDLVRRACEAGYIVMEDVDLSEIEKFQPYQAIRKRLILSRLAAMTLMARVVPRYSGLGLVRAALGAGLWPNAKSFLGLVRRIVLGRL